MASPYEDLPPSRFWRSGVAETHPLTITDLYRKKFEITPADRIATAGSCFAQHISNYLRGNNFSILDKEPPPPHVDEATLKAFGYTLYSARYGNIYTVRQLLQLAEDAFSGAVNEADFWMKDGRLYDALRPNVEPRGFESLEEAVVNRKYHLQKVRALFEEMTVFIFTLGLTETWMNRNTGRAYPTAPGTIAGKYDPNLHEFKNFTAQEIRDDFVRFYDLIRERNPDVKIILTVSPVPLTATAVDHHVLISTVYSKSALRAAAGELADRYDNIDYFPSYEIIASPWSKGFFYESNLRSVNAGGVAAVMRVFFAEHGFAAAMAEPKRAEGRKRQDRQRLKLERRSKRERIRDDHTKTAETAVVATAEARPAEGSEEQVCEDILLEAFAP